MTPHSPHFTPTGRRDVGRQCHVGREPEACRDDCIDYGKLPRGRDGDKANRLCPAHDDEHASLSVNPGTKGMRMVWCCGAGCSPEIVRDALLDLGIHPSCLGNYGNRRESSAFPRAPRAESAVLADARRWHAVAKLPDINGSLLRMCIQAIGEGDGDLPGDPCTLLPVNRDDFCALASRAGLDPKYRYRLYRKWLDS
jgi:hypothetical protein